MKLIDNYTGVVLTAFFVAFFIKNIITTIRTKKSIRGGSGKVTILTLTSFMLLAITYMSVFKNPTIFISIHALEINILRIAGLVLISIAFILGVIAMTAMKDSWRIGIIQDQVSGLIVDGIFKYSRNPFFLSYILLFLGVFLIHPSIIYLIVYLAFVVFLHLLILDEEKYLKEKHGESYLKYMQSVPRYFSFISDHDVHIIV